MSLGAASTFPGDRAPAAGAATVRCCEGCGYDLRALERPRCPECGLAFDPDHLPPADIPWLRRGDRMLRADATGGNAFVAYWRTVWLVLARPKKFGETVWQDVAVDAAETTSFRWITIGIAVGSVLATLLAMMMPQIRSARLVMLLVLIVPTAAFFWLATARFDIIQFVAIWFAQETRYRRLHDMSCAGLALAPIVPMFLVVGQIMGWPSYWIAARAFGLVWVVILAWWYGSLRYQIHGGHCRTADAILHALLLPFAWCMIGVLILVFTLGMLGFVLGMMR
ncbi:MAG: hypothetical protein QOE14_1279 [Humisphaera sp.]|nr:hypothetical protein [Humisphaera sp.]